MPNLGLTELIILLFFYLVPIVAGGYVCASKNQPTWLGVVLGFFLSWIGLIIVLFLPRRGA